MFTMKEADADEHRQSRKLPGTVFPAAPPEARPGQDCQLRCPADYNIPDAAAAVLHGLHLTEIEA
ncbi:hypothetical protein D3C75_1197780 [compost metagenome]